MQEQRSPIAVLGAQRPAVLYARAASKKQGEGDSIPSQQELLRTYGSQLGLVIVQEFVDAGTTKRPAFAAMVSYLKKHPACRVLLVEKTDRLYRHWRDYLTIDELDLEIHLVQENVVLRKGSRSSEQLMHGIKVLVAKNCIDNLREEVQKGLHTKAAQGSYPSCALLGYLDTVGPDGRRIVVSDPVFGPRITNLFTWFASGVYSLKALAKKAYEEGFRFRKTRGNGRIGS